MGGGGRLHRVLPGLQGVRGRRRPAPSPQVNKIEEGSTDRAGNINIGLDFVFFLDALASLVLLIAH